MRGASNDDGPAHVNVGGDHVEYCYSSQRVQAQPNIFTPDALGFFVFVCCLFPGDYVCDVLIPYILMPQRCETGAQIEISVPNI